MSQSLNWLPDPVPENILFVLSVVEGAQIELSLGKRTSKPAVFKLKGLDVFDKQELVQTLLARHHKKLDEGAFSGEMRVLLSKKEADNPLFLTLACEELRVFGIFEKIGERVKKLSQTLPLLLQEILTRLEEDHGRETARQALSLIVCSRNGLDEEELGQLILPKLAPANLQRLIRAVSDFIKSTENENSLSRHLDTLCLSQVCAAVLYAGAGVLIDCMYRIGRGEKSSQAPLYEGSRGREGVELSSIQLLPGENRP